MLCFQWLLAFLISTESFSDDHTSWESCYPLSVDLWGAPMVSMHCQGPVRGEVHSTVQLKGGGSRIPKGSLICPFNSVASAVNLVSRGLTKGDDGAWILGRGDNECRLFWCYSSPSWSPCHILYVCTEAPYQCPFPYKNLLTLEYLILFYSFIICWMLIGQCKYLNTSISVKFN